MQPHDIESLLKKYEMGEATPEEKAQLVQLIEEGNNLLNAVLDELQVHKLKDQLTNPQ